MDIAELTRRTKLVPHNTCEGEPIVKMTPNQATQLILDCAVDVRTSYNRHEDSRAALIAIICIACEFAELLGIDDLGDVLDRTLPTEVPPISTV